MTRDRRDAVVTLRIPAGSVITLRKLRRSDASDKDALKAMAEHYSQCHNAQTLLGARGEIDPKGGRSEEEGGLSLKQRLTTRKVRIYESTKRKLNAWKHDESTLGNAAAELIAHAQACDRTPSQFPRPADEPYRPPFMMDNSGLGDSESDENERGKPVVG